ncbi:hypothetical protein RKE30_21520 [Streptomyces sp. Li-HN-5-11]|nr:hypothetical protein [Streptomyces sp. Li-HN-5-11]WNM32792.1 hypothetical protein RKE30_21520 [Streptomyces sp. Li-HN-5-11]
MEELLRQAADVRSVADAGVRLAGQAQELPGFEVGVCVLEFEATPPPG